VRGRLEVSYVHFQDKAFKKAVKKTLNITADKVTTEALSNVRGVYIHTSPEEVSALAIPWQSHVSLLEFFPFIPFNANNSDNGRWIEDLEHFTHIHSLRLYAPTDNLSFLSQFQNLVELFINDSLNKDWSFIPTLTRLRYLSIRDCMFPDLTPIRELHQNQEQLYKEWKNKHEGSAWYNNFLECLSLKYCGITDISSLKDCHHIVELDLSHNKIKEILALSSMRSLYYLSLRYNQIQDITALKERRDLYHINLRHNIISDISVFGQFEKSDIGRLFLEDNPIADFSPLRKLRLVRCDIDEYEQFKREQLYDKAKRKPCEAADLIALWTLGSLYHTFSENTNLAFYDDGTGFIHWYQLNETFECFEWTVSKGRLRVKGTKHYYFEDEKLKEVCAAMLGEKEVRVWKTMRKDLAGKEIDALEFSEPLDMTCEEFFGFVGKDLENFDYYQKIRDVILKNTDIGRKSDENNDF